MKNQFWCEPAAKAHVLAMASVPDTQSLLLHLIMFSCQGPTGATVQQQREVFHTVGEA